MSCIYVFSKCICICWDEHSNPMKKSSTVKHIEDNLDHVFNFSVLANDPKNMFQ